MPKIHSLTRRPVLFSTLAVAALALTAVSYAKSTTAKNEPTSASSDETSLFDRVVVDKLAMPTDGAPETQGTPPPPGGHDKQGKHDKKEGDDKESPLEQAMQMMQGGEKRLGKALEKKDLAAALTIVVDMEKAAQAAKVEVPPKADEISDAKKKAEFVAGFRKQLITLQKALCDLEVAAIDGKADDASRIFDSVIRPMKKEGHAKYKGD